MTGYVGRIATQAAPRPPAPDIVSSGAAPHRNLLELGPFRLEHDVQAPAGIHSDGELFVLLDGYAGRGRWPDRSGGRWDYRLGAADILTLWRQHGPSLAADLAGSYAIVVVDVKNPAAWLIRDRFGTRPLYYSSHTGCLSFSSSIRGLSGLHRGTEIDAVGLRDILHYRFSAGARTLYDGVSQVLPDAVLHWAPARQSLQRYWHFQIPDPETPPLTIPEAVARTDEALNNAIADLAATHDSAAIPLSGGVDSSLLLAVARRHFRQCVAYTAEIEGFENPELERARKVAKACAVPHVVVAVTNEDVARLYRPVINALEEPPRQYNNLVLAQLFSQIGPGRQLLLCGDGADTLFGAAGARRMQVWTRRQSLLSRLPGPVREALRRLAATRGTRRWRHLHTLLSMSAEELALERIHISMPESSMAAIRHLAAIPRPSDEVLRWFFQGDGSLSERRTRLVFYLSLATELHRNNRLARLTGHTVSHPFLAPQVYAVAAGLTASARWDMHTKPVLRALLAKYLPREIAYWPKLGFPSPDREWLAGPLAPYVSRVRGTSTILDALVPREVRSTLTVESDHNLLWSLMAIAELFTPRTTDTSGG